MTLDQAVDIMEQYAEHMSGDSLTCLEHMVLNMHSLTQPQIGRMRMAPLAFNAGSS